MTDAEAAALIGGAVGGGVWAELGAGDGTFTRALAALLGPAGVVYAVDRDRRAVAALARIGGRGATPTTARVEPLLGDLTTHLPLPVLDGVLLANALHFVPAAEQGATLRLVHGYLRPGAPLVVVEYDDRPASRWVPAPVPLRRLATLAREARLAPPEPLGSRPSAYGGRIYAAILRDREG